MLEETAIKPASFLSRIRSTKYIANMAFGDKQKVQFFEQAMPKQSFDVYLNNNLK